MTHASRLAASLLALRLTVFLVMLMWTVDKFVNPQHATTVYEHFYGLSGVSGVVLTVIGALELAILLAFVAGLWKMWTYGAVLVFHAVSTLSSFRQYFDPWEGAHLLFFAAWPMLAACLTLFLLRDDDVLLSLGRRAAPASP